MFAELKYPDFPDARYPIGPLDRAAAELIAAEKESREPAFKTHPRNRYVMACHTLSYRMITLMDSPQELATKMFGDEPLP